MILVKGLTASMTSAGLKALFSPFGEVIWTRLVNDTDGCTVTFGYVEMAAKEEAEDAAVRALDGTLVMEQTITVHLTNDILPKRTC